MLLRLSTLRPSANRDFSESFVNVVALLLAVDLELRID
jgi:hypothetical protein